MGARSKGNPPRKRGPKPEAPVLPGPWDGYVGKVLKKKPPRRRLAEGRTEGPGKVALALFAFTAV
jgi:hypothetical protein